MNTYQAYLQPQRSLLGAEGPGYQGMVMPPPKPPGTPDMPPTSSLYRDPRAITRGSQNWNRLFGAGGRMGYMPPGFDKMTPDFQRMFTQRNRPSYFNPANYPNNPYGGFTPGWQRPAAGGSVFESGYQRPVYGGRPGQGMMSQMPIQYVQPTYAQR